MRILLLAMLLAFQQPQALARVGHDQGNGGDLYAAEFVQAGERGLQMLRHNDSKDIDLKKLELAILRTKVESTDKELRLNGLPKDAINYPAKGQILFNRARWAQLDAGQKPALVLHEYLGILGIEDASYAFSKKVLGAFRYDISYSLNCDFNGGKSNLNMGIDESAGVDVILMTINWSETKSDSTGTDRPTGEFSQMILDGNFSIVFDDKILVSLQPNGKELGMKGHLAAKGKVYPLDCKIEKLDLSLLEKWDAEHGD